MRSPKEVLADEWVIDHPLSPDPGSRIIIESPPPGLTWGDIAEARARIKRHLANQPYKEQPHVRP